MITALLLNKKTFREPLTTLKTIWKC